MTKRPILVPIVVTTVSGIIVGAVLLFIEYRLKPLRGSGASAPDNVQPSQEPRDHEDGPGDVEVEPPDTLPSRINRDENSERWADRVLLQRKLEPGVASYHEHEWQTDNIVRSYDAWGQPMSQEQSVRFLVGIVEEIETVAPGGGYRIRGTFDRFAFWTGVGSFDTDSGWQSQAAAQFAVLKDIIGGSFVRDVDRGGRLTAVRGVERIFQHIRNSVYDPNVAETVKLLVSSSTGWDQIGTLAEDPLPDKPVEVGYRWAWTDHVPLLGLTILLETEDDIDWIEERDGRRMVGIITRTVLQNPTGGMIMLPTGQMATFRSGRGNGTRTLDLEKGAFVYGTGVVETELSVPATYATPPQELTNRTTWTTRVTSVEDRRRARRIGNP